MVLVASGYASALIVLHGGADQWLLLLGTVITTGWLIGALSARIKRLSTQARTDVLTGLVNRRGFDEHIELALESARRDKKRLSLVLIDLDHLKAVNDRHGHLQGDAVLCQFAHLCTETVGAELTRLGGDEFAIIASDHDQPAATALAYHILEAVRSGPRARPARGDAQRRDSRHPSPRRLIAVAVTGCRPSRLSRQASWAGSGRRLRSQDRGQPHGRSRVCHRKGPATSTP